MKGTYIATSISSFASLEINWPVPPTSRIVKSRIGNYIARLYLGIRPVRMSCYHLLRQIAARAMKNAPVLYICVCYQFFKRGKWSVQSYYVP